MKELTIKYLRTSQSLDTVYNTLPESNKTNKFEMSIKTEVEDEADCLNYCLKKEGFHNE